jgi:ABC-type multidrug transport system fused ATPase/permease subunit
MAFLFSDKPCGPPALLATRPWVTLHGLVCFRYHLGENVKTWLRQYKNLFVKYLGPQRLRVLLLTVLICGHIGLLLASPQIVRAFIDRAGAGGSLRELTATALLFLGVAIAGQVVSLAVTYLGQNVAWTATNALRFDLALHCLRLDMSFHKAHTPGELIERVDGDVSELAGFFSQLMVRLLNNGLLVLGILLLVFREDWRIGLLGSVYVFLVVAFLRRVQKPASRAWGESRQAHAELFGFLGERLVGTEDIRANGGEPYVMLRLYRLMRALLQRGRKASLIGSLPFIVGYSVFMLVVIVTLGSGARLFMRGLITIGTVYLLLSYVNRLYEPLQEIQRQVADLQRAAASVGRVNDLLRAQPKVVESARAALPAGPLAVAFTGVSFRYDDGKGGGNGTDSVLQDVSFELAPGKVLGLLGRTGSGKTTLTRLLFRLYDPDAGAIALGGVDIRDVGLSDLRGHVGMVTQDVQLFRASIRDNLAFFSRRISDERILTILHEVGLERWYAALPAGLDTVLEAGGGGLSAGEAQLLALARVFLRDPGLVILDEASSRLDPATERLLEQAVDQLLERRTAIVIAHRLATVQRADEIVILDGGNVCEYGPRQALAADPASRFYGLLQTGLEEVLA